jgi:hypothetical protein
MTPHSSSRHYVSPSAKLVSAQALSYAEKKKAALEKAVAIKEERRRKALEVHLIMTMLMDAVQPAVMLTEFLLHRRLRTIAILRARA